MLIRLHLRSHATSERAERKAALALGLYVTLQCTYCFLKSHGGETLLLLVKYRLHFLD